jgi:hypothetical protein
MTAFAKLRFFKILKNVVHILGVNDTLKVFPVTVVTACLRITKLQFANTEHFSTAALFSRSVKFLRVILGTEGD